MDDQTRPTHPAPPAPSLETVACPLCGARDDETYLTGPDRAHPRPGTFRLARCGVCGAVYQSPRPPLASLGDYYPGDYMPYATAGHPSLARRLGWRHGHELYRRCRFVARHQAGGQLLDVGCATGTFLAGIQDFGQWRVWGLEMNLGAARVARRRGLAVAVGYFEDLRLAEASLDAVTLWDVLEHLPDPVAALTAIRRALRPTGRLYLNVPTLDSLDARLFGRYWCGLDLPRHLTVFDRRSLVAALDRAGLEVVAMGHPTGSHYSVTQSLRQVVLARVARPAARACLVRWTYGPGLRAGLLPYCLLAEAAGRGAGLTVAARPRLTS